MDVFIIGSIGGLLVRKHLERGDAVHGLVRRWDQQAASACEAWTYGSATWRA